MKFNIGDKVRTKTTGRVGEVIGYKEEIFFQSGHLEHTKKYQVEFNSYTNTYYLEENLMFDQDYYKFTPKFEKGLLDLMININLDDGNLKMVKNYQDQKEKLG